MAALVQTLRQFLALRLSSNFTTTNLTATSTALSFNIGANEVWIVDVQLTAQCSSTGGVKYAVTAPASATIEGWVYSSTSAIATLLYQRLTAINTLTTTALHTVATTPAPDIIRLTIVNSATPGVVAIQAASVTSGQTTTVFAGSWLRAQRVA